MDEQTALRILKQAGLEHTPDSLQRLIVDGRVKATGSVQQGNVVIDTPSLQAYVQTIQKDMERSIVAVFGAVHGSS